MEKCYPLTKEQERMWIEWKLDPQSHSYNTNIPFKFIGHLDTDRFRWVLDMVVKTFDAFRTRFDEAGGTVQQKIQSDLDISIQSQKVFL